MKDKILKQIKTTGIGRKVLIPVDFSLKQDIAIKVGFEIARRLNIKVTLIHASVLPMVGVFPQFPDDFNGLENENSEIEEMEMSEIINHDDDKRMNSLKGKIIDKQKKGELPDIDFNSVLASGMPEEVIVEYCSVYSPELIVMATRGRQRREEELVGSVTAEVIDNARVPIFSIPEDYKYFGIKEIVRICAFCHLDGNDFESINELMKMFGSPALKIWLFPVTDKIKNDDRDAKLEELYLKLTGAFPNSEFFKSTPDDKNLKRDVENFFTEEKIQLILAPNRKRNIIARFFRPGLAHKILYERDIPMFVMPV